MIMRGLLVSTAVLAGSMASTASGTVLFSDDFEAYADTTAMEGIWSANGGSTLDSANGFGGSQALAYDGSGGNSIINLSGGDVVPTATENVVLKGKIFDDGNGNKRVSIGFRSSATFPLFEMGMYNGPQNYASRITLFPGANPSWVAIGADPNQPVIGWNEFTATFTLSEVIVDLDYGADGSVDETQTTALSGPWTTGLSALRLGGPSGVSSAGGGALFDDISVELVPVPEPASLALLSAGALACLGRRRK